MNDFVSPADIPITSSSKPGGLAAAPISMETCSCLSSGALPCRPCRALALEVDHDGVAGLDAAAFHRLEPGRAVAQALERLVDGVLVDDDRRAAALDRREVARVEGRHHVEGGRERERLAFVDVEVLDVRLSTGWTPCSARASWTAWPTRCSATS